MTLRRRSFDDHSALEAAVDHLLRRFDGLTEEPPTADPVAGVEGAVEPAFLVASKLADDVTRAVAHFVCDMVADEVEIQAALDALPLDGDGTYVTHGRVVLSEGAFRIDGTITIPEGAALVGSGVGTVLFDNDAGNMQIIMSDRSEIGNMSISSDPGT